MTTRTKSLTALAALGIAGSVLFGGTLAASAAPVAEPDLGAVHVEPGLDLSQGVQVLGVEVDAPPSKSSRLASCDIWRNAVALPGGYRNSINGCAVIGASKTAVVYYAWEKTGGTKKATACVQGKGFNALKAPVWQNAGCGSRGSTALLWGNVLANKQIRMFASTGTVNLNWR